MYKQLSSRILKIFGLDYVISEPQVSKMDRGGGKAYLRFPVRDPLRFKIQLLRKIYGHLSQKSEASRETERGEQFVEALMLFQVRTLGPTTSAPPPPSPHLSRLAGDKDEEKTVRACTKQTLESFRALTCRPFARDSKTSGPRKSLPAKKSQRGRKPQQFFFLWVGGGLFDLRGAFVPLQAGRPEKTYFGAI